MNRQRPESDRARPGGDTAIPVRYQNLHRQREYRENDGRTEKCLEFRRCNNNVRKKREAGANKNKPTAAHGSEIEERPSSLSDGMGRWCIVPRHLALEDSGVFPRDKWSVIIAPRRKPAYLSGTIVPIDPAINSN